MAKTFKIGYVSKNGDVIDFPGTKKLEDVKVSSKDENGKEVVELQKATNGELFVKFANDPKNYRLVKIQTNK